MPNARGTLILLLPLLIVGCGNGKSPDVQPALRTASPAATENRVPGEYLIRLRDVSAGGDVIRQVFRDFGIVQMASLGNGLWQMRLARDPGLEVLERLAAGNAAIVHIQPNYRYRQQTPPARSMPR
ncbi:MAG TPA: hypothetical protein ENI93_02015 [Gammaproteobacteria bacterium]|nr:hypothetical protein [Gammaproteobacteria bacterium]